MSLIDKNLFEELDKVAIAIERFKGFEPPEGYYLAFSGGKDSIVIKALADMAGVKYDAHYSITTIDPPEVVQFIKKHHPDVIRDRPKKPFLQRMVEKGFPQRQRRWCCAEYKENGGAGRMVVTGVRWAESSRRASRKMNEICYKDSTKRYLHVIIDWTDKDVWEFIKKYNIPYCELYDQEWKRVGCLFCPMAGKHRMTELIKYPKYTALFKKYFIKLYNKKKAEGKTSVDRWKDGEDMFYWWIDESREKEENPDQMVLFE